MHADLDTDWCYMCGDDADGYSCDECGLSHCLDCLRQYSDGDLCEECSGWDGESGEGEAED